MNQVLDQDFIAGDERAEGTERFAEGADQDRYPRAVQTEVLNAAAPARAQHAQAVCVVEH